MKTLTLIAIAALAAAPAAAQTIEAEAARLDALRAQQDIVRQQLLASERQAAAAENRVRTAQALQSLQTGRSTTTIPTPSYSPPVTPAPLDAQMAADAERLRQLQDRSLAEGNARIRAIKPATPQ